MDGAGLSERNIYLSGAHVRVESISPIYPRKGLHLSALAS